MTTNDKDEIIRLRKEGMKVDDIAAKFGVSKARIYQVAGYELKQINLELNPQKQPEEPPKRKRGRPKGSKQKNPALQKVKNYEIDPKTGYAVAMTNGRKQLVGRIGDEKVTAFVQYHLDMMKMRQGCDRHNVPDLYARFWNYLQYCADHGIVPNNMNAYYAIGIYQADICLWKQGQAPTPEHTKFAQEVAGFFASVHEQAPTEGLMNPISAMFWQKAHDGMIEASKLEVVQNEPLGEKKSAEEIAKSYEEVVLPD